MNNVKLNFDTENQNGNVIAIAEVNADSENKASSILDEYLEENYPQYGRTPDAHFEEDGEYYFKVVE